MLLILLLLIIAICIIFCIKWTKQEIADYYGICRKTLGKWVRYCSPNINYEKWKKVRKLNVIDILIIFHDFGFPEDFKPLTKGEIISKCETYYHTIRENIALNFEKLGINRKAYSSLDIFPPRLSFKMVEIIGE